ncbi:MAG TPA: radical SAM protein [Methanomicrobia archaeon]|nr:radical SAM protein [Methanomicrobia archaeon]
MQYTYLFGPVPSRRLGASLGVDLVPYKTCTLDCVYCECGPTTDLTITRKEYVPTDTVIDELDGYLSTSPSLDFITFSGAGESLLHSGIGRIVAHLKEAHPDFRLALLTNGTLFSDKAIRREVRGVDVILPSLDAATLQAFSTINRPHPSLVLDDVKKGLTALCREHEGEVWLEVFIVPGVNDTPEELDALAGAISEMSPDMVQLNSLDRPGSEEWVEGVSEARLREVAHILGIGDPIHAYVSRRHIKSYTPEAESRIMQTLKRRPCTARDLADMLGLHENEIHKYLEVLIQEGHVTSKRGTRGVYFIPSS